MKYEVEENIASAHTLPGAFYSDTTAFDLMGERVFARSWQWIGEVADVSEPRTLSPREDRRAHV